MPTTITRSDIKELCVSDRAAFARAFPGGVTIDADNYKVVAASLIESGIHAWWLAECVLTDDEYAAYEAALVETVAAHKATTDKADTTYKAAEAEAVSAFYAAVDEAKDTFNAEQVSALATYADDDAAAHDPDYHAGLARRRLTYRAALASANAAYEAAVAPARAAYHAVEAEAWAAYEAASADVLCSILARRNKE